MAQRSLALLTQQASLGKSSRYEMVFSYIRNISTDDMINVDGEVGNSEMPYPLLQELLHLRAFCIPHDGQIGTSLERRVPDLQADHQCHDDASQDHPAMDLEPDALGRKDEPWY